MVPTLRDNGEHGQGGQSAGKPVRTAEVSHVTLTSHTWLGDERGTGS